MTCLNCDAPNLRDYLVCSMCENFCHFTNRADCRCTECFAPALRERFPGLALIATSDDPPGLRRVEFNFEALKPEYRLEIAQGLAEMIKTLAKAA